jgi:hypothetical protein
MLEKRLRYYESYVSNLTALVGKSLMQILLQNFVVHVT